MYYDAGPLSVHRPRRHRPPLGLVPSAAGSWGRIEPAGSRDRSRDSPAERGRPSPRSETMKISRPAYAAAALGTTLLLGACFAGHTAMPAPAPGTVTPAPATRSPSPSPNVHASPSPARPPAVAPPAPAQAPVVPAPPATPPVVTPPMILPPRPAPMVRPPVPAPRRVVPPRPMVPRPMVPPAPALGGNDHDADNNGGPDDGDGNK